MQERGHGEAHAPGLKEGVAWCSGMQASDNSLVAAPPTPYVCTVAGEVAHRSWWAARTGLIANAGREIVAQHYVDPDTRYMYAQPHPDDPAARTRDWDVVLPVKPLPFEPARELARWVFRRANTGTHDHEAWWRQYFDSTGSVPPRPLALPADPQVVYRDMGWLDFKDWLVKPATRPDERQDGDRGVPNAT